MTKRGLGLAAGVLASMLAAAGAAPAAGSATDLESGLWYVEETGIAEAHEIATGEGVTIAMLGSPVNPDVPQLQGSRVHAGGVDECRDETPSPPFADDATANVGTSAAMMVSGNGLPVETGPGIQGIAPGADLLVYNFHVDEDAETGYKAYGCEINVNQQGVVIEDAVQQGADIILIPTSFPFAQRSVSALIQAMNQGVIVVAGNPNISAAPEVTNPTEGQIWAPQFNGAVGVESVGRDGGRVDPVVREENGLIAPGNDILTYERDDASGEWTRPVIEESRNQLAAAYAAGVIALGWSARPEATGNQVLEALVSATSNVQDDPARTHEDGFGDVDVVAFLDEITTFDLEWADDLNPFLADQMIEVVDSDSDDGLRQPTIIDFTRGSWFPHAVSEPFEVPEQARIEAPNGRAMPGDSDFPDPAPIPRPSEPVTAEDAPGDPTTESSSLSPVVIGAAGGAVLLAAAAAVTIVLVRRRGR